MKNKCLLISLIVSIIIILGLTTYIIIDNAKDNKKSGSSENSVEDNIENRIDIKDDLNFVAYGEGCGSGGNPEDYKISWNVKIPKIISNKKELDVINSRIKEDLKEIIDYVNNTDENSTLTIGYTSDYDYVLNEEYLSLSIGWAKHNSCTTSYIFRTTYNYDLKDNKLLTNDELFDKVGIVKDVVKNKIQTELYDKYFELSQEQYKEMLNTLNDNWENNIYDVYFYNNNEILIEVNLGFYMSEIVKYNLKDKSYEIIPYTEVYSE